MVATADCPALCFDTLIHHLDGANGRTPAAADRRRLPDGQFPLFVTWKKRDDGGSYRLRGCIGTFAPQILTDGLRKYSLTSALNDRRFSPVGRFEVADLHCAVSLLVGFEPARHVYDWDIGRHGITIDFNDPDSLGVTLSATYLPEVCREQGWDHRQCIDSLMAKAGYRGRSSERLRQSIRVTRYLSSKASLSYDEYVRLAAGADDA